MAMASSTSEGRDPVEFCKGVNGLDKIILREARGSSAEVYLYGAHVTSWKNNHREELLFFSSKAIFKPPKAIRGGIPICFPQFGGLGSLEQHGFARNRFWSVDPDPPPFPTNSSAKAFVDLMLKPTDEDLKIWPHRFEFRLRITLGPGGDLMLTSRVRNTNTDGKAFSFTFAYHTYFSVSDISEVRVEGLEALDYLDNLQNRERFTEQGDAITFETEVDKIYLSTPTKIAILDHERKRTFVLRKDGLPDAVVWNPWDKKAKAMADFGDDEYKHMLCVEAAAIEKPITLKPGEEWKGRQELSAVPSSYCSGSDGAFAPENNPGQQNWTEVFNGKKKKASKATPFKKPSATSVANPNRPLIIKESTQSEANPKSPPPEMSKAEGKKPIVTETPQLAPMPKPEPFFPRNPLLVGESSKISKDEIKEGDKMATTLVNAPATTAGTTLIEAEKLYAFAKNDDLLEEEYEEYSEGQVAAFLIPGGDYFIKGNKPMSESSFHTLHSSSSVVKQLGDVLVKKDEMPTSGSRKRRGDDKAFDTASSDLKRAKTNP